MIKFIILFFLIVGDVFGAKRPDLILEDYVRVGTTFVEVPLSEAMVVEGDSKFVGNVQVNGDITSSDFLRAERIKLGSTPDSGYVYDQYSSWENFGTGEIFKVEHDYPAGDDQLLLVNRSLQFLSTSAGPLPHVYLVDKDNNDSRNTLEILNRNASVETFTITIVTGKHEVKALRL